MSGYFRRLVAQARRSAATPHAPVRSSGAEAHAAGAVAGPEASHAPDPAPRPAPSGLERKTRHAPAAPVPPHTAPTPSPGRTADDLVPRAPDPAAPAEIRRTPDDIHSETRYARGEATPVAPDVRVRPRARPLEVRVRELRARSASGPATAAPRPFPGIAADERRRDRFETGPSAPDVHIHIGRVELTALDAPAAAAAPSRARQRGLPVLTLDEYLRGKRR